MQQKPNIFIDRGDTDSLPKFATNTRDKEKNSTLFVPPAELEEEKTLVKITSFKDRVLDEIKKNRQSN